MRILITFIACFSILSFLCLTVVAQSCGFVSGKPINLLKPVYPVDFNLTEKTEIVEVKVIMDKDGRIASAKAVSGNQALLQISEEAARRSRFSPNFPKMTFSATIKYTFLLESKSITVAAEVDFIDELKRKSDAECLKYNYLYLLKFKADEVIVGIVGRVINNQTEANSYEAGFVVNGKAEIGIRLKTLNKSNIRKLKSFEFEIIKKIQSGNVVVGRMPIGKLKELLEFPEIIYVFPFWIKSPPKVLI